jgi:hypothetical protein
MIKEGAFGPQGWLSLGLSTAAADRRGGERWTDLTQVTSYLSIFLGSWQGSGTHLVRSAVWGEKNVSFSGKISPLP